ncbi:MAG: DUF4982 domain-containing protein [Oscillospiraceae bacterium]|nr:DUF4982 domain-containing protein [Oscillospiraceae bacterium]
MKKQTLRHGWTVLPGDGSSLAALFMAGVQPKPVTLPHDLSVEQPRNPQEPGGSGNGFFHEEDMVYKTSLTLDTEATGKRIWLEFEAVYQNAFVYVNNAFAGKCAYGYSNFYLDISDYVSFGQPNEIKVLVKNGVPSGRWYTGGGIYRDVNLMIAEPVHLMPDGVFVKTESVDEGVAELAVCMELANETGAMKSLILKAEIKDAEGSVAAEGWMPVTVRKNTQDTYKLRLFVKNPALWDAENPRLYSYTISVLEGETLLDSESGSFGIRKLQLDPVNGLRVNGKTVKLRGGCIHHDNGVIGTREFTLAADERVKTLKALGFNALRSSHYPMSRKLLEACDRYGMYVMDEYSDVWTSSKVAYDYGVHMTEWWEHDIANLVRKDKNHPCVILYSIGNEIPEVGNKLDVAWGKKLADRIRELDPTRYVVNSMNLMLAGMDMLMKMAADSQQHSAEGSGEINSMMSNWGEIMIQLMQSPMLAKLTEEAASQVDVVGYNYALPRYEPEGSEYPNRILVGSETNPPDLDKNWEAVEKLPYVIGDFDWTAWDYLGETGIGGYAYGENCTNPMGAMYSPYPWKAAYCGDVNLIGDRRPITYWREMIWGFRTAPYIAVQPPLHYGEKKHGSQWCFSDAVRSWNHKDYVGKGVVVEVYAVADEVELLVNGRSLGRKATGEPRKYIAVFDTVYEPGKLEAIAYQNGVEIGRDVLATANDEVKLVADVKMTSDTLPADASDIAFVDVSVVDEEGRLNMDEVLRVAVSVEGPAELIGYGTADPAGEENYYDTEAKTYEGRIRAAVRATGAGEIRVNFVSGDMTCSVTILSE